MPEQLHLPLIISVSSAIFRFFRKLGVFGLFFMSALDSSFLVLPFGNDLLLIALVNSNREGLAWIAYVLASVIGSVIGVIVIDLLMRRAGEKGLEQFLSQKRIQQLKSKFENKAFVTVFLAALIPPPFPFTPVVMTASALQAQRGKLLGAVFVGRLVRFGAEAILALYFGRQVIAFINSDVVTYVVYGLIALAIVLSTLSVMRWLKRN